jgi:hypothetical protein
MNYDFFGRLIRVGDVVAFAYWQNDLKEGKVVSIDAGILEINYDVVDWSDTIFLKPDKVIRKGF